MPASAERAGDDEDARRAGGDPQHLADDERDHRGDQHPGRREPADQPRRERAEARRTRSSGIVVTTPAMVPDRCRPARTSSSSGPRLVSAARRLSATSRMPAEHERRPASAAAGAVRGERVGGGGVDWRSHDPILESWDEFWAGDVTDATDAAPSARRAHAEQRQRAAPRAGAAGGEWPVGSRIPTEPQLVEALGVGRNTVREAVRALVHAGVLECRQGSGTYVIVDRRAGRGGGPPARPPHRRAEAVEVRRAFEVEAARLAALRAYPRRPGRARRRARRPRGRVAVRPARRVRGGRRRAAHGDRRGRAQRDAGRALRLVRRGAAGPAIADERWADELRPEQHVDHDRLVAAIRAGDPDRAAREAGSVPGAA